MRRASVFWWVLTDVHQLSESPHVVSRQHVLRDIKRNTIGGARNVFLKQAIVDSTLHSSGR